MVAPRFRSRKRRRVSVRIPSGKSMVVFKKRKKGKQKCPCGKDLLGSAKKPKRGLNMLCSVCARNKLVQKARSMSLSSKE